MTTTVDPSTDQMLGLFTTEMPDLSAKLPCCVDDCDTEAIWLARTRHLESGQVCQMALFCEVHKVQLDTNIRDMTARARLHALLLGQGIITTCHDHDLPMETPFIAWSLL